LKKIKSVVENVGVDGSRYLMIFGLGEEIGEDLNLEVETVFAALDEKPKFEAERVGTGNRSKCRPVKVVLRIRISVCDILQKSKELKKHKILKNVYLEPDRTIEERR
jgi:hypothetical protein